VVATLVGRHAPADRQMGHAGALIGSERETAAAKLAALREAGARTADTPYGAIAILKEILAR
jgi:succinyl-CoA synthetase alpha subunit